jgi:Tol biopolymer transport system component
MYAAQSGGDFVGTAIADADGTVIKQLPQPGTVHLAGAAWSPDGSRIAFQAWDDADPTRDGIYIGRSSDAGDLQRLTDAEIADIPADFSPDGKSLLVFRESATQSVGAVDMVTVVGGKRRQISPPGLEVGWGSVTFSPDGLWILFTESRTSTTGALFKVRPDGTSLTKVFEDPNGGFASSAVWSPDGSMIMFSLNPIADDFQHPANKLYVIDADGTNLRLVLGGNDHKRPGDWVAP